MATGQFDPDENAAYAKCSDCGADLQTQADGHTHLSSTMVDGRSHRISITNATRPMRVSAEVERQVDRALDDFAERLDALVDGGDITAEEISAALAGRGDFSDAWANWLAE